MNSTHHHQKYRWYIHAMKGLSIGYFSFCLLFFTPLLGFDSSTKYSSNSFDKVTSTPEFAPMVCNDLLNLSLRNDCEIGVSISLLLENPSSGANIYYVLQLFHENGDSLGTLQFIGDITTGTTSSDLSQLIVYGNSMNQVLTVNEQLIYAVSRFTGTFDNNGNPVQVEDSCWGYLVVEDKNGPICQPAQEEELLVDYDINCDGVIEVAVNDPSGVDDLRDEYILCSLLDENGVGLYFDMLEAEDADVNNNGVFGEAGLDVLGDFRDCSGIDYIYFEDEYRQICSLEDATGLPIDASRFNPQTFEIIEVYQRTWSAIDNLGQQSSQTCSQYVFGLRPKANQIILEEHITSTCETGEENIAPFFMVNGQIENNGTGSDGPMVANDKVYFLNSGQISCKYAVSFHEDEPTLTCAAAYKKTRHWTVSDCCDGDLVYDEFSQLIEVSDETAPQIWLDADQDGQIDREANGDPILAQNFSFSVNTSFFDCSSDARILSLLTSDNCTPETAEIFNVSIERIPMMVNDNFFFVPEFPNGGHLVEDINATIENAVFTEGEYILTYFSRDDCGNVGTATLNMTVEDERAPVAICNDELRVALSNFEDLLLARVYPEDLDDSSTDNCKPLGYLVRSISNVSTADDIWHPYLEFSCGDVQEEAIEVELLVYEDRNGDGNFIDVINNQTGAAEADGVDDVDDGLSSICSSSILVEDRTLPQIICEDKTIDCDDTKLEALRQNFLTEDSDDNGIPDTYYASPTLFGGCPSLVEANLVLQVFDLTYDANCHFGTFVRRWTYTKFIDGQSYTATCDQIITVNYEADWTMTFPTDIVLDCTPELTDIPPAASIDDILVNDGCSAWGMEVEEEIFDTVGEEGEGACFKIVRTYKFLNGCTYDPTNTELAIVNRPEGLLLDNPVQLRHRSENFSYNEFGDENDEDIYNEIISPLDITAAFLPPFPTPTDRADDDGAMVLIDNDFNFGDEPQGTRFLFQRQYNEHINDNDNVTGVYAENYGYFAYRQVIKIRDSQAPMISPLSDLAFCDTSGLCAYEVLLCGPMVEECRATYQTSYSITDTNGTVVATGEFPIGASPEDCVNAGLIPIGNYQVTYRVADGCGNLAIENFQLDISDCKAPVAYCFSGLTVDLMSNGMVELWASDFDAGSYDACCEPLHFSFNEEGDSTSVQFTCDDLSFNAIDMWVMDDCGNSAFCSTVVIVQNNVNNDGSTLPFECEDIGSFVPVSGWIQTETGQATEGVVVHINQQDDMAVHTNVEGFYHQNLNVENDYSIVPENNTNPLNGVTTLDLILIKKHILGIKILDSPYKLIAADVNRSNSLSTLDLVQLRKLILNIEENITGNSSWRFVPKSYTFPNPSNPWATIFPEIININDLSTAQADLDFVAIKVGDVNDSSIPNLLLAADETETSFQTSSNTTTDKILESPEQPSSVILYQNKPNPFSAFTTIAFYLPKRALTQFVLTDMSGQVLYQVVKTFEVGHHDLNINRGDLPRGLVLLSLKTAWGVETRKMVIAD